MVTDLNALLRDMPPHCSCDHCVATQVKVGRQLIQTGKVPASIALHESMGSAGVSRVAVVVMDDVVLRQVFIPALQAHVKAKGAQTS